MTSWDDPSVPGVYLSGEIMLHLKRTQEKVSARRAELRTDQMQIVT
jgi:hypothetical protein